MLHRAALRSACMMALAVLFILSSSCNHKKKKEVDPAFAQFISAFTSGHISAAGAIQIRFTEAFVKNITLNEPVAEELISFTPSISGELKWIDNQTLQFQPSQWLEQGQEYEAKLHLARLLPVPKGLSSFEFTFAVLRQHLTTGIHSVRSYTSDDLSRMKISGMMHTVDVCKPEDIEKTLSAKESSRSLPVTWVHSADMRSHEFTIDSVYREMNANQVLIIWNGKPIGAEQEGVIEQAIPSLNDFHAFFHRVVQEPEQYVILQFSDPLDPTQDLNGLIDIPGILNERFTIEQNEIRIYPPMRISGEMLVNIHPGIRNIMGHASTEEQMIPLLFEDLKPAVEFLDQDRTILPSTNGKVIAFKAVNLSNVDVRVIRIFESNVPQFLQVNDLNGDNEMTRVGRQVVRKTIPLSPDGTKNLAHWNTFYLDLDDIIRTEPGAIYRVEMDFKKSYSLYPCESTDGETAQAETSMTEWESAEEEEDSRWDYYDSYWYDEGEYWDYDWDQRDNPCDKSYYVHRRPVGKNILATDIGLIVKKGTEGSLECFTTDLRTALPLGGVKLALLSFQQQRIAEGVTDANGRATFREVGTAPHLLVAKRGAETNYLKLDNGRALPVSSFDIGGSQSEKGLKGFLYGERGVWRPGDTLFLSFILQDENHVLPRKHPIVFELNDARGKQAKKITRLMDDSGIYAFACPTSVESGTGTYTATVRVGGATFSRPLRVETIKPNRLKIEFNTGGKIITSANQKNSSQLSARWLHGGKAHDLKAMVTATFVSGQTEFTGYKNYIFQDPVRRFAGEEQVVFDGRLDAEGKALIPLGVTLKNRAPGMIRAHYQVKVFEEGGDFSVDRFSVPFSPYDCFVGLRVPEGKTGSNMLETDKVQTADVVCLNADGKILTGRNLRWTLYKVDWRWWWEQGSDNLSNYVSSESNVPLGSGTLTSDALGKGKIKFSVPYPEWGRFLLRVEDIDGGHATGQTMYIDWPDENGRNNHDNPEGATMLSFTADKEKYTTGESCTLTIPSGGQGRILVSVENGSHVIQTAWVKPEQGQTRYTFLTTAEMSPNAYVHVTLLQPHDQTANDLPIRLYGIIPLFVENPGSHLDPTITMRDELEPEKGFDVQICEKNGKGMTYTLAIVDEGLLDLTRFSTPDPWNHFYAREALGVNTFDMYDQVIGAIGGKMDRLISIGGSDEAGKSGKNTLNRFKPVVMYAGPFTLKKGECKKHHFAMPNYVGSVRVMVVSAADKAYGKTEKSVPVKRPLMVLASLPRVISPGEAIHLPVTLFAMDPSVRDVSVEISPNEFLKVNAPLKRTVQFKEPGDLVIDYPVSVASREGRASVKVTATSGKYRSTFDLEVDVRSPNPYQTKTVEALVEAGKQWSSDLAAFGIPGTQSAILEVSSIPPVDFGRRMKYLLEYPHGCAEQTTSQAFPQLYLADVIDLDPRSRQKASDNVKAALKKIPSFQTSSGGIGYWPGSGSADDWCTSFVGQFAFEAEKKGYTLPAGFEASWVRFQKNAAQNWRPASSSSGDFQYAQFDLLQAYRLYTLALSGNPELGAMNRLREYKSISAAARWRLAAAYALSGQKETARQLVQSYPATATVYKSPGYSYGSQLRDEALITETLLLLNDRVKAAPLVRSISMQLSSSQWHSTQSTAAALLAVSRFATDNGGPEMKYTLVVNGQKPSSHSTLKSIQQQSLALKSSGNSVVLTNTSKSLMYVRVLLSGKPTSGDEFANSSGLALQVNYKTIGGQALNPSRIEQGTDFYAEVEITHTGIHGQYDQLALTQVFPGGWEIINSRMDVTAGVLTADNPDYLDIRDDRVNTYFNLNQGKKKTFRVKLNAAYAGRFYLPAVQCEAMYDHSISATVKGQWVEVIPSGGASVVIK